MFIFCCRQICTTGNVISCCNGGFLQYVWSSSRETLICWIKVRWLTWPIIHWPPFGHKNTRWWPCLCVKDHCPIWQSDQCGTVYTKSTASLIWMWTSANTLKHEHYNLNSYLLFYCASGARSVKTYHCPNTCSVCVWVHYVYALTSEHTFTGTRRHFCDQPVRFFEQLCLKYWKKKQEFHYMKPKRQSIIYVDGRSKAFICKLILQWWRPVWPQSGGHPGLSLPPTDPCLVRRAASLLLPEHKQMQAASYYCVLWRSCSAPCGSDMAGRNPWSISWSSRPRRHTARGWGCCWCNPRQCTGASLPSPGGSYGQYAQWSWRW